MSALLTPIFAVLEIIFEIVFWLVLRLVLYGLAGIEALLMAIFRGREAATQRMAERGRQIRKGLHGHGLSISDDADGESSGSGSIVPLVALLVILAVGVGGTFLTVKIRSHLRQKRIAATTAQVEALADHFYAELIDDSTPQPQSMLLADVDGWGEAIVLEVSQRLLDTTVIVRSAGPDGFQRTRDDIAAHRTHSVTAKEAAGELLDRGLDAARERASRLFGGGDDTADSP